MTERQRLDKFAAGLEKLSVKYGIVIKSVGGVSIYDEGDVVAVQYSRDHTSGDLLPEQIDCVSDEDETPSMTM